MGILRRRAKQQSKAEALAEARKATRRMRRTQLLARRWQQGKQENPIEDMTPTQWLGGPLA